MDWFAGANRIAIGPGSVAHFIAMVVDDHCHTVSPIYLGKPNAAVFNFAIAQLQQRTGMPPAAQPEPIPPFTGCSNSGCPTFEFSGYIHGMRFCLRNSKHGRSD